MLHTAKACFKRTAIFDIKQLSILYTQCSDVLVSFSQPRTTISVYNISPFVFLCKVRGEVRTDMLTELTSAQ